MNIRVVIFGFGALFVAAAAFFFLRSGTVVAPSPSAAISITSTLSTLATTLAPNMTLTVASSTELLPVASTKKVYPNDTLTTSHSGRGLLQAVNGTATLLDYDTTLTLVEDDGTGVHVTGFLGTGMMWARVEKLFGKGEYYQIKTQNSVAVVRGTSFGVSYVGGISTLEVATGTVGFIPVNPATGELLEKKEVFVSGGNKATIDDSGNVQISPLTITDKKSQWYLFGTSDSKTQTQMPPADVAPSLPNKSVKTPIILLTPKATSTTATTSRQSSTTINTISPSPVSPSATGPATNTQTYSLQGSTR